LNGGRFPDQLQSVFKGHDQICDSRAFSAIGSKKLSSGSKGRLSFKMRC
jgi:hypothetical protein